MIFAPDDQLVPTALAEVRQGGRVVCGGTHMSDIPRVPYESLSEERSVLSVANLTREDACSLFEIIPQTGIVTYTRPYPLPQANAAVAVHRPGGTFQGAAVLVP